MIDRLQPTRRPEGPPAGYHLWRTLLFLHWEVPAAAIQALLPPRLTVDTFEGRAFVGLVPFTMRGIRVHRQLPPIPGFSSFHETNVRTYVHLDHGAPGVWFFSLDAANAGAVLAARVGWHLPYFLARMHLSQQGEQITYRSHRLSPEPTPADLSMAWTIGPAIGTAAPGTLEHFLCERYLLYTQRGDSLLQGQVHHTAYPLHRATVDRLEQNLVQAAGFDVAPLPSLPALYSPGVDVEVFDLIKV